MAFIAINAKSDISGSKKGKITPDQNALINAFCLSNKTGILDIGDKCTLQNTSIQVQDNQATIIFNGGYIVICGRLVECESGTTFTITAPSSGTEEGKIILRYDLQSTGNEEFKITTKKDTETITTQDLNENPKTGIYELELYSYVATSSQVTLTINPNIKIISTMNDKMIILKNDIISEFTQQGKPLYGYNTSKGSIEKRLTELGFKEGNATNLSGVSSVTLMKLGKFVICKFIYTNSKFSFNIPDDFLPFKDMGINGYGEYYDSSSRRNVGQKIQISISKTNKNVEAWPSQYSTMVGCTMQIGWSTDSNYDI